MRRGRILGDSLRPNVYHIYSRIINREKRLQAREREEFQRLLLAHATMAGLEVFAFAIMPNHFHVLVRVPEKEEADREVTDEVLLDRLSAVYPPRSIDRIRSTLEDLKGRGDEDNYHRFRGQFLARMHDLSIFVKEVKARFTMGSNKATDRSGPLWEDRFRSVLLQGDDPSLLLVVASYIDLNPVRAGIVSDPKDYRHCGYGGAVGGDRGRVEAIGCLLQLSVEDAASRREALAQYRMLLFSKATPSSGTVPGGAKKREGVVVERIREVMDSQGRLPRLELLRCRVRYLTDSLVLGSHEFVDSLFPGRSRPPKKVDLGNLEILREVRGPAIFPAHAASSEKIR
ncbi:hypothetical protein BH23VER1_BH23VER1_01600 [soil metagenome]